MASNDFLLEPGKSYNEYYRERHKENTENLFDDLVRQSGVNADENRALSQKYREKNEEAEKLGSKLGRIKALRVLLIILAIVGGITLLLGITEEIIWLALISPVAVAASLLVIFLVLNKKIKTLKAGYDSIRAEADNLKRQATAMLSPLFALFKREMTHDLIMKTVPELTIDRSFTPKKFEYLYGKYGYGADNDQKSSTLGLVTGEIVGNPFVFERKLRHWMGKQAYVGSLTIHWVTYSRDSNGKTVPHHHTQVLHATVVKPKPFYTEETSLVYANDAAPDLSFSHKPSHAEKLSEKQLKSTVKSGIKKIRREAKNRIAEGFTEMGNEEFDVLFGAIDRDNEVQFRLLYTPLAQKNTLSLMKGESPYGDDFSLKKTKCLNCVVSEHAQKWNMDTAPEQYHSYDIDICRNKFTELNSDYFSSMYFDLAPLLSIPLYQQHKPSEYRYSENYRFSHTLKEAENLANRIGEKAFAHPASRTRAILKAEFIANDKDTDTVKITAYSHKGVFRVDFIPVLGGDGRMHLVPVPWIQYFPVSKVGTMRLKNDTEEDRKPDDDFDTPHAFFRGLYAEFAEEGEATDDSPDVTDEDISKYGEVVESDKPVDQTDDKNDK